ncbi:MAG TPA: hypothetical protein VGA78_16045, partial [Gemmatimonadales bacterium]
MHDQPGAAKGVVTKPNELTEVAGTRVRDRSGVEYSNIRCGFSYRKIIKDCGLPSGVRLLTVRNGT